jgi:hypothetical protein
MVSVMQRIVVVMAFAFAFWALEEASQSSQDTSRLTEGSVQARAESDNAAIKETLINLEKQSWEAWKTRDGKFFQEFLSDDHVEVGLGGTATKAQIVALVASPVCAVKSYSINRFEFTMFDANTALLTYHAAQDTNCKGIAVPSPVWATSLYIRRDGRWFNVLYQQTPADK